MIVNGRVGNVTASGRIPLGGGSFASGRVTAAIKALNSVTRTGMEGMWLSALGRLAVDMRPDIANELLAYLGAEPSGFSSHLQGLSIGEIGVVYEALTALADHRSRRENGQYFTPDDVAMFMAEQSTSFPVGTWLDPCCGVGNLSFHLTNKMGDPERFVAERLVLSDVDPIALKSAVVLLIANFAAEGDHEALAALARRSSVNDFLGPSRPHPYDFAIFNPPYARTQRRSDFRTGDTGELYAYFFERVLERSKGFIAITPASHLGGSKYSSLRRLLDERDGGDVLVFDNVPDTCFRGYKYGSTNTSKTNFVRAAITISAPSHSEWRITPILRWAARSRSRMWSKARSFLLPLRKGPAGEWAKIMPGTERLWDRISMTNQRLSDLIVGRPTQFELHVASTPRYYISATKRDLDRGSKHVLYFESERDRERAYLLLNSSLPYWWWRCLDGGITLPLRILLSTPLPEFNAYNNDLLARLGSSEQLDVVTKLNAGRQNENVRRPRELVMAIDDHILRGENVMFDQVFASDMFAPTQPS